MGDSTTATFSVQLVDETSGPAADAASALVELKAKIEGDVGALRAMQSAMRNLKGGTVQNVEVFRRLRDQITAQKAAIADAQSKYVSLGGSFAKTATAASSAAGGGFEKLIVASRRLPGPLGTIGARLDDVTKLVAGGGAIAAGFVAIAAASALLAVGVLAGVAALLRYGIVSSDARRSELLRIQALGGTATAATDAQRAIEAVSSTTAMPRAQVEQLAAGLYRAGHRGAELEQSLRRLTIRKLGGAEVAARRLLSLDVQADKLKENLSAIFGGLKLDKFLGGLSQVTALLSQSTSTGRALKAIVEAIFGPMIDDVGDLAPIVKRFFQGIVIGALHATIVVLKVRNALRDMLPRGLLGSVDMLQVALWAGVVTLGVLVAVVGVAALAFAALAASVLLTVVGLTLLALPLLLVAAAAIAVGVALHAAVDWFKQTDFGALGRSLIDGLVKGLLLGRSVVVDAVRGIARDAQTALTDALGIHSPSRVFAELGAQIPRGLALGIESGAGMTQAAADEMAPGARGSLASTTLVSIGDVHVHVGPGADARQIAVDLRAELASVFEGVGLEMGVAR